MRMGACVWTRNVLRMLNVMDEGVARTRAGGAMHACSGHAVVVALSIARTLAQ
jgi:hypothetical protein